jgi:hypothetical protein
MKSRSIWRLSLLLMPALLWMALAAPVAAAGPTTSGVFWFPGTPNEFQNVPGASASLVRTKAGVSMNLRTSMLEPNSTVTIWWVVFNYPQHCATSPCGLDDLANPLVQPSVQAAAGHVIGGSGIAGFGGHLRRGDTSACQPELPCGQGLVNPTGAEVHLVVRSHGPAIPGMVPAQIHTFAGGCEINTCTDLQAAVFQP